MTDSAADRPRPSDSSRSTVLLGDVTASSVTAWSVLGELRPLAPGTSGGDAPQPRRTPPAAPSPVPPSPVEPVEPVELRRPDPRPQPRRPQTREQGRQREQLAQRDRQTAAQRARDEDTRRRQVRPGPPVVTRPVRTTPRQDQSTVRWTAQPTAVGAPRRSTATSDGRRSGRSRTSAVRVVGLVVVVVVLAGRCLGGLT